MAAPYVLRDPFDVVITVLVERSEGGRVTLRGARRHLVKLLIVGW
jgi:hypothetical protein